MFRSMPEPMRAVWAWLPVIVGGPCLAFPLAFPTATIGALAIAAMLVLLPLGSAHGGSHGLGLRAAPLLLVPMAVLLVWVLIGASRSEYLSLAVPKLAGLVLGWLIFRAVWITSTSERALWWNAIAFLAAGCVVCVGAVFISPQWQHKFSLLMETGHKIPKLVPGLPGAERGVNPSALGGTTLFFLPPLVVLALGGVIAAWKRRTWTGFVFAPWPLAAVAAGLLLGVLLLSQSRSTWIAAALSCVIMISVRYRFWALVSLVAAVVGALVAWIAGPSTLISVIYSKLKFVAGPMLVDDRPQIWSAGVDAILSHPLTGVGLGGFRVEIHEMQLPWLRPGAEVAHAHNQFIQVALDTGIPGLVAYIGILVVVTTFMVRVQHDPQAIRLRNLCLGLWGGLLATHLFGVFDSLSLGAKVNVFFWWILGLLGSIDALKKAGHEHDISRPHPNGQVKSDSQYHDAGALVE